ncbi:hypothetical protein GCM10007881_55230 [Mesorhizobium huakuii]|uniref:hypothetical protein n=1 Tax=Mesorhizobium huakuii TaxID=28104 RepID=UPI00235CFDBB|nr:hypothetical protein [Mesorhizobium huakuii]GLQ82002.1 hypothetical protein GCM10007881_55230 [Mesorhizobium huakuii]
MTALFGMASGWWSVSGLSADMTGVAILAWDLIPEFRLYKAGKALARARIDLAAYQGLIDRRTEADTKGIVRAGYDDATMLDHFGTNSRASILLASLQLSQPISALGKLETVDSRYVAISKLEMKLAEHQRRPREYRPPIGVGIFLIVTGFIFQLIGAVP